MFLISTPVERHAQNPIPATSMAFVLPSRQEVYAWARWNGVEWVSTSGEAGLDEMRHYCAEIQLVSEAEAVAMENARYRKPWEEISEARFIDQLEVLPPVDWHWGVCESFKSSEMYGGDVTSIFAKYKGRFFECRDLISLKPKEIMESIITTFFAGDSANSGH